jgi:hypothetical protein
VDLLKYLRPKFDEKYSNGMCEQIHLKLMNHVPFFLNEYIIKNFINSINSFIYVSGHSIITQSKISDKAKILLLPAWKNYNVQFCSLPIHYLDDVRSEYINNFVENILPSKDYDFFDHMILFYVNEYLESVDYELDGMNDMRMEFPPSELMRWFKFSVFEIQRSLEIFMPKFRNT